MVDITAMCHQVVVPLHDPNIQVFVVVRRGLRTEPEVYIMKLHLFRATSSPYCAKFALQKTTYDHQDNFLKCITKASKGQFYVDDLLIVVETI